MSPIIGLRPNRFKAFYRYGFKTEGIDVASFDALPERPILKLEWSNGQKVFSIRGAERYFFAREGIATPDFQRTVAVLVGGKWNEKWFIWRLSLDGEIKRMDFPIEEKFTKPGLRK